MHVVLIAAAAKCGARGVGYELDAELAAAAIANVRKARLEHLVSIVRWVRGSGWIWARTCVQWDWQQLPASENIGWNTWPELIGGLGRWGGLLGGVACGRQGIGQSRPLLY